MALDRSELSSLNGLIEQVTVRVGAMAEEAQERRDDNVANQLFGVERALSGAVRRLSRLLAGR